MIPLWENGGHPGVQGTWTLSIEHFGVKLVLEQQKGAVTGTLDWPTKADGTLLEDYWRRLLFHRPVEWRI